MSRIGMTLGLIVGLLLHLVLLVPWFSPWPIDTVEEASEAKSERAVAQVVAMPNPPEQSEAEPEEQAAEPEPKPEPTPQEKPPQPEPPQTDPKPDEQEQPPKPTPPPPPENEPEPPQTPAEPEQAEQPPTEADSGPMQVAETQKPSPDHRLSASDASGAFAPPDSNADLRPSVGIAWGSPEHAQRVLKAGGMLLAVLAPSGKPEAQVVFRNGRWQTAPLPTSSKVVYSNQARLVQRVPAFRTVTRQLRLQSGRELVVYVPQSLQRQLQAATDAAAQQVGIQMSEIRRFGGEFELINGGNSVRFVVNELWARD